MVPATVVAAGRKGSYPQRRLDQQPQRPSADAAGSRCAALLYRWGGSVQGPQPEVDGRKPSSSDGLVLAVVGDVPDGRVLLAGELDMLTAPRFEQLLTD